MVETRWYFDCEQCGYVGKQSELKDHPTRPIPDDLGFCPDCGLPAGELVDKDYVIELAMSYDEDPTLFIDEIDSRP